VPVEGGQFTPVLGGQFAWIFHWKVFLSENKISSADFDKFSQVKSFVGNFTVTGLPPIDPDAPCDQVDYLQVGPFVPYQWSQWCGFNDKVRLGTTMGCSWGCGNDRPPSGSAAVAVSEIMAYYQHPTSYTYTGLPTSTGNSNVQTLIADAAEYTGTSFYCSESFLVDNSGSYASQKIVAGLKDYLGFTYASQKPYEPAGYLNVMSDLDNQQPVILTGHDPSYTDHHDYYDYEWICDGYSTYTYHCPGITYLWLHFKWGWPGGNYDGWFMYNYNWTSNGVNYYVANRLVWGILP
jgi:hypothetical protein